MTAAPTIIDCLKETVCRFPERPAVSDAERTVTYRELWQEVERYAAELDARGVARGRANLVEANASVSFVVAALGTFLAGRVLVPYAPKASSDVVRRMEQETEGLDDPELAEVLFTTGTTGRTKGVMLSHRAVWAAADSHCHFDRSDETTVCLIASPLNHVGPLRKLHSCFLVGAHVVLHCGFIDLKGYYGLVERHRVNLLFLPPAAVLLLILASRDHLHGLAGQIKEVYSAGSPMVETVRESLRRCLPNTRLMLAYGATETSGSCCAYDYAELPGKAGCVGRPSSHSRITAEDGALVVAGDTLMKGYLNDPVRTAEVLRGGYLHTHDLGRVDGDGFVYVIGRQDDVINCGGIKVSPTEVEEVAMQYPGLRECACFGIDSPLTGSAVKLLVVPVDASRFDVSAFRDFLQRRLERHQVPTQITCAAEIPKINGKPDRKLLKSYRFAPAVEFTNEGGLR